ncbi:hypothetical protein Tco_1128270 [Tanacetum coccineum]|uniref:Uncharacterized protein n=1 Tax=Tanacetum coccineum TaxID=301880 RepID=A0ABQ5A9N0_9ASTR
MVLMVEQNLGEHLICRFARRGNKPDPRDVKIAIIKQRILELDFSQLQQDSPTEEAETESNEEEYPFVNKYLSFQEESIVLVEEESCPAYVTNNEEEESMSVYDTDIEDVIEEEEGFVRKGGFGGEEDNIEDIVVVANDLCSLMIQTILSVDFKEDVNTKSHELMSFGKSIIIKDDGSEDVNSFGVGNPGFHDDYYDNLLLTKETESEPIIWDIGDEEEEYPFVNKYPSFQEESIVLVKEESCFVYDTNNEEEESMPVYDTDIEYVIKEEEGFVRKRGYGG